MTEREAAVEWLEGLTPIQRATRFRAAVSPIIGHDSGKLFMGMATVKSDHETDRAHCAACKDPNAVVIE